MLPQTVRASSIVTLQYGKQRRFHLQSNQLLCYAPPALPRLAQDTQPPPTQSVIVYLLQFGFVKKVTFLLPCGARLGRDEMCCKNIQEEVISKLLLPDGVIL